MFWKFQQPHIRCVGSTYGSLIANTIVICLSFNIQSHKKNIIAFGVSKLTSPIGELFKIPSDKSDVPFPLTSNMEDVPQLASNLQDLNDNEPWMTDLTIPNTLSRSNG